MRRKGKALIIEDHPDWQERLQDHLEEGGFKVKVANTFEQAINEKVKIFPNSLR